MKKKRVKRKAIIQKDPAKVTIINFKRELRIEHHIHVAKKYNPLLTPSNETNPHGVL